MIETLYDTMRPLLKARNRLSLPHREMLLALCILTLATAIYLKDVLFLGQRLLPADLLTISEPWRSISDQQVIHNYNLSDPIQTHYPRQIYFWHSLQQGHYPTWNPYIFLGIPCDPMTVGIFADIGQIVTSWPSFFLPLDIAWGIVAALRLVLAGFFMYLLMRHFKASFSGALLSAIIFMFGANTIVWLEYPHHLATQLWMPLIFLFFDRMLVTRRWVDALLTTVFLSLMLYTRYLQLTFYVMLTLIPYFLWHLWRAYDQERDWHTIAKMILLTTVAVGGALMMASVKIAVFHQATLHSIRAGQDRAPTALTLASLPTHLISRLVTFYFPTFYSDGITYPYWGPGNTVEASQYVALLPLFLIAIAITHWSHQRRSLFFVGLGAALLLIRMRVPPLANIISALPFMNVGSISRLTTVITFVLAIIAGLGLTALEQKGRIKKRTVIGAISGTLVIGFFIVGAAWWIYRQKLSIRPYTINNLWSVLAMTGVLLGWLYLFLERNTRRRVMALGMVCLTFVDLLAFGGNFNTTASPEMVYPSTGATDFLLRDPTAFRVLVLHDANNPHEIAPSDTLQTYQIPEVGGRNPHLPQQYYDFFSQVLEEPGVTPNGYLLPAKFQKPALWGMLNVKYILTKKALPKNQMESLHLVYDDELKIYRTTAWLPRIFAVTKVRVLNSEKELLEALRDPSFEPEREALLLREPRWNSGQEAPLTTDQINLEWIGTNDAEAAVHLSQPRLLIFSTRYDPGWHVYVDDSPREIYRANGILMAVPVEAGDHSVRFVYAPKSRQWNLGLRTLTPLILAGIFLILGNRTKQHQHNPLIPSNARWALLALIGLAFISPLPALLRKPMPERSTPSASHVIETTFSDMIELETAVLNEENFSSAGQIELTLHWRALQSMETSYTVFVHVVGTDGAIHAQRDTPPLDGKYPTNIWQPQELITDFYQLTLPAEYPPGELSLMVGLYDPMTLERLPALKSNGDRWPADGVLLETTLPKSAR